PLATIVAGLETLSSDAMLEELISLVGPDRLVFSLDLLEGRPLLNTKIAAWQSLDPLAIAQRAIEVGVTRMIVLDLAQVGTGGGTSTNDLCRQLKRLRPNLEITSGGGVRGPADLELLAEAGCDFALVASALHDGRITPQIT